LPPGLGGPIGATTILTRRARVAMAAGCDEVVTFDKCAEKAGMRLL